MVQLKRSNYFGHNSTGGDNQPPIVMILAYHNFYADTLPWVDTVCTLDTPSVSLVSRLLLFSLNSPSSPIQLQLLLQLAWSGHMECTQRSSQKEPPIQLSIRAI